MAASLRGLYLRSWRYGAETEKLVGEALERESWEPRQWAKWQEQQLGLILHRAATQVPYYREHWQSRRRQGDASSWEYLENWPVLEKESLRQNPAAFVAQDYDRRKMFHDHTSGTTGKPLNLWGSRQTVRHWYALFEARARQWYGVSRFDRWGILGGQLVVPALQSKPPFWVWNAGMRQLYLSAYHLAPSLMPHYLSALRRYRVKYLLGYTSALYALAQQILQSQRRDIKMDVVITNAEPLFEFQRQAISEAFQCPVRETYGMAEIVTAASECQHKALHIWPEVGITEVFEGDRPAAAGNSGDFICTGLLNAGMPLIRYRVGDRGRVAVNRESCACGRGLPILQALDGRADDVLYTADGRRIGRLDPILKEDMPICEAQIVQEDLRTLRVRYVPAAGFSEVTERTIIKRLQARMGSVDVVFERVEQVPRTANGKFRAVVCKLSPEFISEWQTSAAVALTER
jgi:phenylacetate-CoA ligase